MIRMCWCLLLALFAPAAMAIEEPRYVLLRQWDGVELRQYEPYVVAEVRVAGPPDRAGSEAFPILAGYIFGKNHGARRLEMTAPVTQAAAPVRMEMTAPVTQIPAGEGFLVQFVLPRDVSLASAPEPLDPRVQLRQIPGGRVAVIRYSGMWTTENHDQHADKLKAALRAARLDWRGEPVLARYNPPITPWFLRRNEIWLSLDAASAADGTRPEFAR